MTMDSFFFLKKKYFDSLSVRLLSASEKAEVGAAWNSSYPVKTGTLPVTRSRGQGWEGASSLAGWRQFLFHFFSTPILCSFVYSPPPTSPPHCVIFFFSKCAATVASRWPEKSNTVFVCQLSSTLWRHSMKWQLRVVKLLISRRIVKAYLEILARCAPKLRGDKFPGYGQCPVYWFGFIFTGICSHCFLIPGLEIIWGR